RVLGECPQLRLARWLWLVQLVAGSAAPWQPKHLAGDPPQQANPRRGGGLRPWRARCQLWRPLWRGRSGPRQRLDPHLGDEQFLAWRWLWPRELSLRPRRLWRDIYLLAWQIFTWAMGKPIFR